MLVCGCGRALFGLEARIIDKENGALVGLDRAPLILSVKPTRDWCAVTRRKKNEEILSRDIHGLSDRPRTPTSIENIAARRNSYIHPVKDRIRPHQ